MKSEVKPNVLCRTREAGRWSAVTRLPEEPHRVGNAAAVSKALQPGKSILCDSPVQKAELVQDAEKGWIGLVKKTDTVLVVHLCFFSWI